MTPDRPDETLAARLLKAALDPDVSYPGTVRGLLREAANTVEQERRLSAEKDAALVQARSVIDSLLQSRLDDAIRFDEQSATLARLEQERDAAREHEH